MPSATGRHWPRASRTGDVFAARAAALAGTGRGGDDPPLDQAARSSARQQALNWLRDDLAACANALGADDTRRRSEAVKALSLAKLHRDLDALRNDVASSELSEQERKDWRSLWADVERLLPKSTSSSP